MPNDTGFLLVNLGTPQSTATHHVRKYLGEFLMDPYVIDIPYLFRALLVKGVILPTRPAKSAHAYAKIWHPERGSPLMHHSTDLLAAVQKQMPIPGALAMRYGQPSIESGLRSMAKLGLTKIKVLPLYPQYSWAASETAIDRLTKLNSTDEFKHLKLEIVKDFFWHAAFVDAFATRIQESIAQQGPFDHVLFSYHGVPERQLRKVDCFKQSHCLASAQCCDEWSDNNRNCYRAQCFETTRLIVKKLGLKEGSYQTAFQSRLGRTPWIKPYTDLVIEDLKKTSVQRVLVVCPSFVADCLETLEEIEIRAKEDFESGTNKHLSLCPSLNSHPSWVNAVVSLLKNPDNLGKGQKLASAFRQDADKGFVSQ
jgi:protoporphyrin/coproporphyrin ferrochelatase